MNRRRVVRNALATIGIQAIAYSVLKAIAGIWHHPGIDALVLPVALIVGTIATWYVRKWLDNESARSDLDLTAGE